MVQIEFVVADNKTGEIKYRNRRTMSLSPASMPERYFANWQTQMLAIFRNCENEKYKNCVCQFSCKKKADSVQGEIF